MHKYLSIVFVALAMCLPTQVKAAIAPYDVRPFGQSISGQYLAGLFAQNRNDWVKAEAAFTPLAEAYTTNITFLKKAMIIAMGAGQHEQALNMALRVMDREEDNPLPQLFLSVKALKKGDYEGALRYIKKIEDDSLSAFLLPVFEGWAQAGLGKYEAKSLYQNTLQLYHTILIADFMGRKEEISALLNLALKSPNIGPDDLLKIAALYARIGEEEKAKALYEEMGKNDQIMPIELPGIKDPTEGAAYALSTMAELLAEDYSPESTQVFAQMALYLNPGSDDARFMLAETAAKYEQHEQAIALYQSIAPKTHHYEDAQRQVAALLEEVGPQEAALEALKTLVRRTERPESLIQLGNYYRRQNEFGRAIAAYDHAAARLGSSIPAQYWHIHYLRGMAYEQAGQWAEAEKDLKMALLYRPNEPQLLNYLGYSWADRGTHLPEALTLLRKAAALEPADGYITDSLGWALYRAAQYEEAVPVLERAVGLNPYDPVMNDHLGDAYWQTGRTREARFQWVRARNHSDDPALIKIITQKLHHGMTMPLDEDLKEAHLK